MLTEALSCAEAEERCIVYTDLSCWHIQEPWLIAVPFLYICQMYHAHFGLARNTTCLGDIILPTVHFIRERNSPIGVQQLQCDTLF